MAKTTEQRLDEVWDKVDDLLCDRKFQERDNLLRGLNLRELPVDEMISYLTVTLPAHSNLAYRREFYEKVREELKSRGHPDYQEILRGLEGKIN